MRFQAHPLLHLSFSKSQTCETLWWTGWQERRRELWGHPTPWTRVEETSRRFVDAEREPLRNDEWLKDFSKKYLVYVRLAFCVCTLNMWQWRLFLPFFFFVLNEKYYLLKNKDRKILLTCQRKWDVKWSKAALWSHFIGVWFMTAILWPAWSRPNGLKTFWTEQLTFHPGCRADVLYLGNLPQSSLPLKWFNPVAEDGVALALIL